MFWSHNTLFTPPFTSSNSIFLSFSEQFWPRLVLLVTYKLSVLDTDFPHPQTSPYHLLAPRLRCRASESVTALQQASSKTQVLKYETFKNYLNAYLIKKWILLHFRIFVYLREEHSFILASVIDLKLIFVIM